MRCCIAAVALFVCAVASGAPRATIDLLPQARVAGDAVTLGQLAHLRSADLDLMRKLVNLPVGRAPQSGQSALVQRAQLSAWIQRQAGIAEEQIQWTGADESRVQRREAQVKGEAIGQAAMHALRSWLRSLGIAGEVQLAVTPRDLEVPAGEVRLQARPMEHLQLRSRCMVWVDVWAGEAFVRTVPVTLELAAYQVLQMPGAGALQIAPLDQPNPLRPAAGAPEEPVAVARGEWASLRTIAGAIALESRVEVLQDGRPGQKVRVRQQGATGIVFARVVGRGQLELAP